MSGLFGTNRALFGALSNLPGQFSAQGTIANGARAFQRENFCIGAKFQKSDDIPTDPSMIHGKH
jgi:hypothetical protein